MVHAELNEVFQSHFEPHLDSLYRESKICVKLKLEDRQINYMLLTRLKSLDSRILDIHKIVK